MRLLITRDGGRGLGMFAQAADTGQRWRRGKVSERTDKEVSCGQLPLARCRWASPKPRANNMLTRACQHMSQINRGSGLVCAAENKAVRLAGWDEENPPTSFAQRSRAKGRSDERLATGRSAVSNLAILKLWVALSGGRRRVSCFPTCRGPQRVFRTSRDGWAEVRKARPL